MIKSLSQSLVAAAFIGAGLIQVQPTARDDAAPVRIARRH